MTVLFKPILALQIINFSSCRNYWGGNDVCPPPPQYFHSGGGCPQPPQDRRLWSHLMPVDHFFSGNLNNKVLATFPCDLEDHLRTFDMIYWMFGWLSGYVVLQIGETIPSNCSNWEKSVKIGTEVGLCILKTSRLGTISVSVPKSNMAAKFKMAAFCTQILFIAMCMFYTTGQNVGTKVTLCKLKRTWMGGIQI